MYFDGYNSVFYSVFKKEHKFITMVIICSFIQVAFAAADSLSGLKLIEAGMSKTTLALFAIPMVPVQIILPLIISKYTAGPRPMNVFLKAIPPR